MDRAPASISRISLSLRSVPPWQVALMIRPSFSSRRMPSNLVPAYRVGVLKVITPLDDLSVGQLKHSPSGILRKPSQGLAPIFLMEKERSVPGATSRTLSALSMRFSKGFTARAILA